MDAFLAATGLAQTMSVLGDPALSRLIVAIAVENIAGGFASVAFVAYLTAMVNPKFAAVQYALLGSLVMLVGSLGRAELGTFIETSGYHDFFILTAWIGMIAVGLSAAEWVRQAMIKKPASAPEPAPQPAE
jgi:PAT family beta-lactamase induction signal transducer AmpG